MSKVIRVDKEVYAELERRRRGTFSNTIKRILRDTPEPCPCGSLQPQGHQCWS